MTEKLHRTGTTTTAATRFEGKASSFIEDVVSVEEPLEIRLRAGSSKTGTCSPFSTTMRTPGADRELAAGFLFTEGVISSPADIFEINEEKCNVVSVVVDDRIDLNQSAFERFSFVSSSCGVCGKKNIERLGDAILCTAPPHAPRISPEVVCSLPFKLRKLQNEFDTTGGSHASCLFDQFGNLLNIKEDVGRHNAVDKVIGSEFLQQNLPLKDKIIMLSGRVSFELVQKAARAGLPIVAAIGAPSSLAVQLAERCGITLVGFVRENRFNVYTGAQRIVDHS